MDDRAGLPAGAGWRNALSAIAWWSPLAAMLTFAGFVIAPAAAEQLPTGGRTEAVIGLTADSEWPFHDSWLALAAGTLDDGTIVDAALRDLAIDPETTRVETEPNNSGSRSTLTVTVTAASDGEAVALANEVVERMVASGQEAPITVLDRADLPAPPPRRSTALAGAFVGLLGSVAIIPWLDRRFGPIRSDGHPEFRGRVSRWVEPGREKRLLPLDDRDAELAAALRQEVGPIAVISTSSAELSTGAAKALTAELTTEVIDGGAVDSTGAARAIAEATSVVVVAPRRSIRRHRLHRVLSRLEALGVNPPVVVLAEDD